MDDRTCKNFLLLCVTLAALSLLLVLVRMKRVELDYTYHAIGREMEKALVLRKSQNAERAELLSIKNLSKIAKKYGLRRPSDKRIIVVP